MISCYTCAKTVIDMAVLPKRRGAKHGVWVWFYLDFGAGSSLSLPLFCTNEGTWLVVFGMFCYQVGKNKIASPQLYICARCNVVLVAIVHLPT
jgi:hypothetical protein